MTAKLTAVPAEHQDRFEGILRAWAQTDPKYREAAARLAAALKGDDADAVAAARETVTTLGRACGEITSRVDFAVRTLFALRDAEGAEALAARIDTMLAALGKIGDGALKHFSASKTLIAAATQRIEALRDDVSDRQRLWARADAWLRAAVADYAERRAKGAALAKKAEAAALARDAKALAAAQKEFAAIPKPRATLAELRAKVDQAIKTRGDVAAEHRQQFEDDTRDWKNGVNAAVADDAGFALDRDLVMALAIAPRDVRKAAKLLGIGNGDLAKLAKVLEADAAALLKGLEGLAKQLRLEMPPKEMFAALKKAQLV